MKPLDQLDDDEFAALARRAAALPEPPPDAVKAAIALWRTQAPGAAKRALAAWTRQLAATLAFDSWTAPPALAGVRSGFSETRHLLFTAAERDVDLRISPSGGAYALAGQILGPGQGGRVELTAEAPDAAGVPRIADVDELGEFRLEGLARGTYQLCLLVGDDRIELPPIAIGDR